MWNVKYVYFESCLGKCIIIRAGLSGDKAVNLSTLLALARRVYFRVFIVSIKTADYASICYWGGQDLHI